jgi:hypothetical protein
MNSENSQPDNIIYILNNRKKINYFHGDIEKSDYLPEIAYINHKNLSFNEDYDSENKINSRMDSDSEYRMKKKIASMIKKENTKMARNIIDDEELFNNLTNEYKLILSELLADDKVSGQEYISKILDHTDDDLILAMVKNKVVYNFLNRTNKIKIIEKLLKNPWLRKEETKLILEIISKGDRNILDNISLQNRHNLEALNRPPAPEPKFVNDNSNADDYFPGNSKQRNKYDDFLTDY